MIPPDRIALLAHQPIPGGRPTGDDARHTAAFEALETEVAKLESLSGGMVDWAMVEREAATILTDHSKHLLVAVRLVRAWYQRHGLDGLQAGLVLLHGLCADFWEDAWPEVQRLRARGAAFHWLSDGLAPLIAAPAAGGDGRDLARCRAALTDLMALLGPYFSSGDCGFASLRRALDEAMAHAAMSVAGAPDEASIPAAAAGGGGAAITSREDALRRLAEIATWFRHHDPHSPVGYLAERAVTLGSMDFQGAFTDLLQNNASARNELWQALGFKPRS